MSEKLLVMVFYYVTVNYWEPCLVLRKLWLPRRKVGPVSIQHLVKETDNMASKQARKVRQNLEFS